MWISVEDKAFDTISFKAVISPFVERTQATSECIGCGRTGELTNELQAQASGCIGNNIARHDGSGLCVEI